ncbi:MAG: bifunctional methylenetetrahydrofolate dehydrogenase/methenyltetrahydrofolate cyclohydrolase FolD [Firmicutes bacterium]|nr:bifunctional methylenetetrahydrofolate dehydrogenase/methenyltetrahydrofolate cyclohydrolase FolD [Bacillota bacterium]
MSAKILDGKVLSQKIKEQLKIDAAEFFRKIGRKIGLAVVLAGDDTASAVYVKNKIIGCEQVGIESFEFCFDKNVSEKELIDLVLKLNEDKKVDGILVQLPLPMHINAANVLSKISPKKDADGFLAENAGNLMLGNPTLSACTPSGVIELIKSAGIEIASKEAVIIGRSNIVGKPIALMLLEENATVIMCHSKTKDLVKYTKTADILIVAAGKKHLVTGDMIKDGSIVIDVGVNRDNGKLYGDVDFDSCLKKAKYITPVPGGVGPMTIAMLLKNVIKAAKMYSLNV